MENKRKFETIRPLIDEAFAKGEGFEFKPNGVSMLPFVQGGRDIVTIEKYTGGAKKFDIIFYQREDGQYVLHRIVKVSGDSFGVCGDNQWWVEKVKNEQIFAVVTNVNGQRNMGGFFYLKTLVLRRFIKHVKVYIKKHFGGAGK